jgi:hypothetical protein
MNDIRNNEGAEALKWRPDPACHLLRTPFHNIDKFAWGVDLPDELLIAADAPPAAPFEPAS